MSQRLDHHSSASRFCLIGLGLLMMGVIGSSAQLPEKREAAPPAKPAIQPKARSTEPLKDGFTNSLGMKFMRVPSTKVLFCIHPTRVRDYAVFAAETPSLNAYWKKPGKDGRDIDTGEDHPVVTISWDDASAFCAWLSKKEGRIYRLPSDREWSYAVGIGSKEPAGKDLTPEALNRKIPDLYPWGNKWPPPKESGNFADAAMKGKFPTSEFMPGYVDGFATTSPVMKFKPNKLGLYDMSGNVWEWCDSWYDKGKTERVLRGGCWDTARAEYLFSSCRHHALPGVQVSLCGFRVAVEESNAAP